MIEAMIDLLFPYGLIIVWIIFILLPEREDEDHDSAKKLEGAISDMEEVACQINAYTDKKNALKAELVRAERETAIATVYGHLRRYEGGTR